VTQAATTDAVLGLEVVAHQRVLGCLDVVERPAGEPDQLGAPALGCVDDVLVLLNAVSGIVARDE
jgi:hypothetical protein